MSFDERLALSHYEEFHSGRMIAADYIASLERHMIALYAAYDHAATMAANNAKRAADAMGDAAELRAELEDLRATIIGAVG